MEQKVETKQNIGIVSILLGLYFLMMAFDSFTFNGSDSLLRIIALLPAGAILLLKRKKVFRLDPMSVMIMVYLASLGITCLYSILPDVSFIAFRRVILNLIVVLIVGSMCLDYNEREIHFLKICLALGGILVMFFTMYFANFDNGGRLTISVNGSSQDQNYINGYLFFAYIYFLNLFMKRKNIFSLIPVGVILYFTLYTGSRGALLAYIFMTVVFLGYDLGSRGKIKLQTVLILIILAIIIILNFNLILSLLPESVAERFSISYISEYGTTGRFLIWKTLIDKYLGSNIFRTFFGYGYGTTAYLNTYNYLVAHNVLIDHLLMGGILGLLIYLLMHLVFIVNAFKTKDSFVIGLYAGYAVMMMCLSLWTYKPIWNMFMMILIIRHYGTNALRAQENMNAATFMEKNGDSNE